MESLHEEERKVWNPCMNKKEKYGIPACRRGKSMESLHEEMGKVWNTCIKRGISIESLHE